MATRKGSKAKKTAKALDSEATHQEPEKVESPREADNERQRCPARECRRPAGSGIGEEIDRE